MLAFDGTFKSRAPAWAATRDAAILELLYGSGLRLSELVALDVTKLDLLDQTVRVLGKGQKERIVPVGRPALKAIHAYRIQAHVSLPALVSAVSCSSCVTPDFLTHPYSA